MFLHIQHNQSGEVLVNRRLAPNEILDPEALTDKALEQIYDGELQRELPNGHIPAGCADYRTEIRNRKHDDVVIWDGLDWFPR
ncbi:hypothetical protein N9Y00_07040 [Tateyamaria sp.]|nr:hypothetical protein [Tateyamaria sp.]